MKYLKVCWLLVVASGIYGQTPLSTIKGIKIISSGFDPQTRIAKLTFMNDTPLNITAWAYCVTGHNATKDAPSHNSCILVDPLSVVINDEIEMQKSPFWRETDCPMCRLIHPGEEHTLTDDVSHYPEVLNENIEVILVAYAGGAVEVVPNRGEQDLQSLAYARQHRLQARQKSLELARQILADANNQHPAADMIHALGRYPELARILGEFKKPEFAHGNDKEFIPNNERQYLQRFVADQEIWVAELSKNQITGVSQ